MQFILLFVISVASSVECLNNGLALSPPMGWLSWQRFRCITDCDKYPNECISEALIKRTADKMVGDGYLTAGYNYVGIDDCWSEKYRDENGKLVPDKKRFPNGMKAVGDYLHAKGFKFFLYQDYGNKTCAGYPGVLGHEKTDIASFVEWGVDYIKLDGCNVEISQMDTGYPEFGKYMNESGREMVYSCSWPAYQSNPDYPSIMEHCNLWRNTDDIEDSWASLTSIMDWFAERQDDLVKYAGPGHWNDPDMLLIGNFGLSLDQARVQMAVWSILAAPLFMSVDLDTIRNEFKEILLNADIIAVDQDELGKQGIRTWNKSKCEIWRRELTDGYAVAFVSRRSDGTPYSLTATFEDMKIPQQSYTVKDLYNEEKDRSFGSDDGKFETRVNPSGVKFYKFIPVQENEVIVSSIAR
ncbi:alpha-N-acetylgalactosaminidase-like [Leptidea sinapis]|uniref:alpha-N-acetylgalactosaminidase-like n=1 Tax=Leptidea sinapis TaxID=189913 RepID=UPI00212CEA63|nr:alpha-N-acetylgalactosaminidase-like [Leptidea sinapis]